MSLVRWDPFRDVVVLQDRINRIFDDAFPRNRAGENNVGLCAWQPAVDIYETDAAIVLDAVLPGVRKEDVTVVVKDNILTITGDRSSDLIIEEDSYFCRERCFGTFSRSFSMQHHVNPEKISAKFKNGVLTVSVPKPDNEKPRQVTVNVD